MRIFLTGGGEQENFYQLDKTFLSELPEGARILVLPLACDEHEYGDVLERAKESFASHKIADIDLIRKVGSLSAEQFLAYDAVYIEGGNTFKLIKEVRHSHLFQYLQKFIEQNKVVYGDSAGAIILGANVESGFLGEAADEDQAKLQDLRGLGLLGNWSVHCHYKPDDLEGMEELMYNTGSPFLALPEPTGVAICNGQATVYGHEPLEILGFTGRTTHPPQSSFHFELD